MRVRNESMHASPKPEKSRQSEAWESLVRWQLRQYVPSLSPGPDPVDGMVRQTHSACRQRTAFRLKQNAGEHAVPLCAFDNKQCWQLLGRLEQPRAMNQAQTDQVGQHNHSHCKPIATRLLHWNKPGES